MQEEKTKKTENKPIKKKGEEREEVYRKALLEGGYVSKEDFELALDYSKKNNRDIFDYFQSNQIITDDLFGQAMAEYYKVDYADLNSHIPSMESIKRLPEQISKKYRAVFFSLKDGEIVIATDNPVDQEMQQIIKKGFNTDKIKFAYSLTKDIDDVLNKYRKPLNSRFNKIVKEGEKVAPEIIDEIINDSLMFKASDIHFEPRKEEVLVRFRVDGVLIEAGRIPKKYYENIINRIKIQAKLRIDDHFSAQDGSMRMNKDGKQVDMRVSIVPTLAGEKIVIRVLAEYVKGFDLGTLGLSEKDREKFEKASKKPFGMILITGPTGSGKTTTLYALLQKLNKPEVNIMTIEDPVEYHVAEINQIQVNTKTNLTFSKGLRSIVRQDPDIILVGEIRDEETVEIAVNASLTGHLLFSTFHSNDSATAIPRLLDMKVEPFLLASTLELIVAQRLIRKLCENCRVSVTKEKSELEASNPEAARFFDEKKITLYQSKGCERCNNTGYIGRLAIFEIIEMTDKLQNLILKNPSTNEIWEMARSEGARSLYEDGIEKVKSGLTTLEELNRIAAPPSEEEFNRSQSKIIGEKEEKKIKNKNISKNKIKNSVNNKNSNSVKKPLKEKNIGKIPQKNQSTSNKKLKVEYLEE